MVLGACGSAAPETPIPPPPDRPDPSEVALDLWNARQIAITDPQLGGLDHLASGIALRMDDVYYRRYLPNFADLEDVPPDPEVELVVTDADSIVAVVDDTVALDGRAERMSTLFRATEYDGEWRYSFVAQSPEQLDYHGSAIEPGVSETARGLLYDYGELREEATRTGRLPDDMPFEPGPATDVSEIESTDGRCSAGYRCTVAYDLDFELTERDGFTVEGTSGNLSCGVLRDEWTVERRDGAPMRPSARALGERRHLVPAGTYVRFLGTDYATACVLEKVGADPEVVVFRTTPAAVVGNRWTGDF